MWETTSCTSWSETKRALQAGGLGVARLQKQEVAVFEQVFRAHLVEDGAAVDFALHGEGHAGGDVGFDQAGDHVHAGALGGDDEVDASGAGFLREAGDLLLYGFALGHHQVGQLVDDDDDERQFFQRLGFVGVEAERVGDFFLRACGFGDFVVVAGEVAHAQM